MDTARLIEGKNGERLINMLDQGLTTSDQTAVIYRVSTNTTARGVEVRELWG